MAEAVVTVAARDRAFFGHPRALSTLFFVEMWERFSFYGMAAILVLYFTANPSAGGAGLSVVQAAAAYALYTGLIYVVSLPGGWVADRLLGSKRSVLVGGAIIATGHFVMAHGSLVAVGIGLAVIIVGTGFLKPNTATMVGDLYAADDPRRDSGFSIYYMSVNLGAFVAPFVTGYLAQNVSWQAGFGAAGVGMALGLAHYLFDWRALGELGDRPRRPLAPDEERRFLGRAVLILGAAVVALALVVVVLRVPIETIEQVISWALVVLPLAYFVLLLRGQRPAVERHRLTAMFILFLATAAWFAVVSQAGSTLNVFAEDDTRRQLLGFTIPAPWFQSINPVCILLFAPPLAWLWTHLGQRQPPTPVKFAVALLLVAASMGLMVLAARFAPTSGQAAVLVSPLWLVAVFVIQTLGELLISPIGLSVATRLAPPQAASQVMGVWMLSLAVGAALSGELANLYDVVGVSAYYGILGLIMLGSSLAIAALTPVLLRLMEGVR